MPVHLFLDLLLVVVVFCGTLWTLRLLHDRRPRVWALAAGSALTAYLIYRTAGGQA